MTDENGEAAELRTETGAGENDRIGRLFRQPMQFLSVAWLITVVVLIGFVWKSYDSYRRFQNTTHRSLEIQELRGQIIYLDEVLTMSARMAAATGDPRWEARYRENEPKLDEALARAQALVPDAQATALTDAANVALVKMENQAFDLSRAGRLAEARDVLSSDEYDRQKAIYAEGMQALGRQLQEAVASSLRAQERRTVAQLVVGVLAILLLLVGWVVVHNLCKKYARA
jgi:CHASE3 domain sensor protein